MATYEHNSAQFGYIDLDDLEGVQKGLSTLGFDPGKIDGIDGPNTEKAVRAFQAHALVDVDGKVGKQTREALVTELKARAENAPKPTS